MRKENKKPKIVDFFKETIRPNNWEIYLPIENSNRILFLRPICSKCKKQWSVDRKECFYCKTKYFRVKQCPNCKSIYPENVPKCANDGTKNLKVCLNCGREDKEREVVFVPITFCWFCGNRKNKFEYKIISY